jgi:hypothetical protein
MGPQQSEDDKVNDGVYVTEILCCWRLGIYSIEQVKVDPVLMREEFFDRLRRSASIHGPVTADESLEI